ncbi:MAG TPA: DUF488 domain-containing protein [Bacteroidales bacterium]|nr:DUF488 domain-containing protein [Bacteroidales bacterium]
MYYRRKILLSLLQVFDNKLEKISLQKLLMLFADLQSKPDFHFVPYKFGCFSFQANSDLSTMVKYHQVAEGGKCWQKIDKTDYVTELKESDRKALRTIKDLYAGKSKDELIRITYKRFPYFALNSTIAHEVLSEAEIQIVLTTRPEFNNIVLFTIGYEGVSLEEYLNKLILNGIKMLCDVRKNSLSMKYGFSKSQLKNACEGVGIKYEHIPDLGIESDKRKELHSQSDYDMLFRQYRNDTLTKTRPQQEYVLELLKKNKRIALTCFEANIYQCHRKHLAEAVTKLPGFEYELKHI